MKLKVLSITMSQKLLWKHLLSSVFGKDSTHIVFSTAATLHRRSVVNVNCLSECITSTLVTVSSCKSERT